MKNFEYREYRIGYDTDINNEDYRCLVIEAKNLYPCIDGRDKFLTHAVRRTIKVFNRKTRVNEEIPYYESYGYLCGDLSKYFFDLPGNPRNWNMYYGGILHLFIDYNFLYFKECRLFTISDMYKMTPFPKKIIDAFVQGKFINFTQKYNLEKHKKKFLKLLSKTNNKEIIDFINKREKE